LADAATIALVKTGGNKGHEPYEQILLMIEKLYRDVRRLEVAVGGFINQTGVSWERIGEAVNISDEGARRRYTKLDDPESRPRRGRKKT